MMIIATFFTVAYSCRISFLLVISYTAKDSIFISILYYRRNKYYMTNFFIPPGYFFTNMIQTFRILSNNIIISSGKSKLKLSESSWTELFIYGVFYSNSNKLNKYFDFIGNSYFLSSILILLLIFIII